MSVDARQKQNKQKHGNDRRAGKGTNCQQGIRLIRRGKGVKTQLSGVTAKAKFAVR